MQDNMNLCPCCGEDNWERVDLSTMVITLDRYTGVISDEDIIDIQNGVVTCCGCGYLNTEAQ